MMPDLGKYAATVLLAYGVSLGLIAVLVVTSLRRSARLRRTLAQAEAEVRKPRK